MGLRLNTDFSLRQADWAHDAEALRAVRHAVFVREQGVPEELEWDTADRDAVHMLAIDSGGRPIGTARLRDRGLIGRMAVLSDWRGRGVGSALLLALLEQARAQGLADVELHAQTHAAGFYARHGFTRLGEPFTEAGIPHVHMRLTL